MSKTHTDHSVRFQFAFLHPRYWLRWLAFGLIAALNLLPESLIDRLAASIGRLCYRHYEKHRRQASLNISWCFPDMANDAHESLLLAHFVAYWQTLLRIPVLWLGDQDRYLQRVRFENSDILDYALANGPVIVLACHSCALDFGAAAIAQRYGAVSMYQPFKNPLDNWMIYRARSRFNNALVPRGTSMRALVKKTRAGVPCYHMPDEDLGADNAVFAPFFGQSKATLLGMGKLTSATRAQVVPCYPYYAGNGQFVLQFLPALEDFPAADEHENSARINLAIEELINIAPAHYLWKLRIFKTREDGGPSPYD
ncbi:MAG: hypothetical protein AAF434_01875 [Pseudomonadota bacterium]